MKTRGKMASDKGKTVSLNIYNEPSTENSFSNGNKKDANKDAYNYIIEQNMLLHAEVARMRQECLTYASDKKAIKKEKEEVEEEVYSLERSRTMMKGYLRNEIEVCKYLTSLSNEYETKIVLFQKDLLTFGKLWCLEISMYFVYRATLLALETLVDESGYFYKILSTTLFLAWLTSIGYTGRNSFLSVMAFLTPMEEEVSIMEYKAKIKETHQANDYIGDLIDGL